MTAQLNTPCRVACALAVALLLATSGPALAARERASAHDHHGGEANPTRPGANWTSLPILVAAGRPGPGGVTLAVQNIAADRLTIRGPEAPEKVRELTVDNGQAKAGPAAPTLGGYHWLSAREVSAEGTRVASGIWSFGSKGDSPQALLDLPKEQLEIIPEPASVQYRESTEWAFRVRFEGKAIPNAVVRLETANGSREELRADAAGLVRVAFPRDFDSRKLAGVEDQRRVTAGFVLAVEHDAANLHYLTAFNGNYSPDRMRERSLGWGAGFAGLGMLLGTPLLLRKRGNKDV